MSESITCPFCKRTSYHPMDVAQKYCGACHVFHGEVGRELKASELQEKTVVFITKEGRNSAMTAWVKDVGDCGVVFYVGELRLYLVVARIGDELHDDTARLHVFQYFGMDEPTSGTSGEAHA